MASKRWADPLTARRQIEQAYTEVFVPRDDGGLTFSLDDHLYQIHMASRMELSLENWQKHSESHLNTFVG